MQIWAHSVVVKTTEIKRVAQTGLCPCGVRPHGVDPMESAPRSSTVCRAWLQSSWCFTCSV